MGYLTQQSLIKKVSLVPLLVPLFIFVLVVKSPSSIFYKVDLSTISEPLYSSFPEYRAVLSLMCSLWVIFRKEAQDLVTYVLLIVYYCILVEPFILLLAALI